MLITLASIGTFEGPEQPEGPSKLEQPVITNGIIPTNANPKLNDIPYKAVSHAKKQKSISFSEVVSSNESGAWSRT